MADRSGGSRFSRRAVLAGLGALALTPIIQACGQQAAPASAPSKPAEPAKPAGGESKPAANTAAQPQAPAQGEVTIRVMDRVAPKYTNFANAWVEKFNAKSSRVKIVYEPRPADWTQKLTAAMAAGAAPELSAVLGEWFKAYMEKGQITPLDQYIKTSMKDTDLADFWHGQYQSMNYQGKQLGMPYYINVNAAYFNLDALAEAGLSKPELSWTTDTFLDYAQKLTKRNGDNVTRYGLAMDYPQYFRRPISLVWELGGQVNDPSDIRKFTFTKPETVAGFQWTHDLAWKHKVVSPTSAMTGAIDPGPNFFAGNAAFLFEGVHLFEDLPENLPFKWDLLAPPMGPAGRGQRTSMDGFVIYSKAKDPDAAWTVLQDIVSPETMRTRQEQAGLIASRKSVAADWPKLYPDKNLQSVFDTMNDAQPDPLSIWDRSAEIWNAIKGFNEQMMLTNTMAVPDALAKMQETVEGIYKS